MADIIAYRQMFTKDGKRFVPINITISVPKNTKDGLFTCRVAFKNVPKYDANIKGADGINALECALSYIDSICTNSEDPEFHWEEKGGRHKGRPL
jgi:hypothetical protein